MVEESIVDQESTLWAETVISYLITPANFAIAGLFQLIGRLPILLQSFLENSLITFIFCLEYFHESLQWAFSNFQITLLQVFLGILCIHVLAICIAWRIYSERITERFLRPSHLVSHEQLKTAVSELKLPAEHTPRWWLSWTKSRVFSARRKLMLSLS